MKKTSGKQTKLVNVKKDALSPAKRRIFLTITFLLPVLFFGVSEICLRIFDYGGDLRLFVEGPTGYEEYLLVNPEVAGRYFFMQESVPTPPKQIIRKEKLSNSFRIFVLGESSTAGFPYGYNAAFPNVLERGLSNTFPEKNIEVITIAMAAINSYTLLDLMDEIIEQSPDAILIYTGHNEYYGAMGVGSAQSIGSFRWMNLAYLKLKSFRTFLMLRDFIGWAKNQISNLFYGGNETDPSATLMARIVAEQTIPYGSNLYEAGKNQFRENISDILEKAAVKNIPVILSELISNEKDLPPFISVTDEQGKSAKSFYDLARQQEGNKEFPEAKQNYIKAKDLDALRFRAPEEFNEILKDLSKKYSVPVIPLKSHFEKASLNGIIGNNLLLEHVHPNKDGYFLIAKAFYDQMKKSNLISSNWPSDKISQERHQGFSELDSTHSSLVVAHLKQSWPFKPKSVPNRFIDTFRPGNYTEEVALRVLTGQMNIESGHLDLGDYYNNQGNLGKAFEEYNAALTSIPTEMEFYRLAATALIMKQDYNKAAQILYKSLKYKDNDFANKWIGQIAFINGKYKEAITYLSKADLTDDQAVFNLSRAYYLDREITLGDEYYIRLQNLAPKSEYLPYLTKLRTLARIKGSTLKLN